MESWGGAQWLVVFVLLLRMLLGAAKASRIIVIPQRPVSPWGTYWTSRLLDVALVIVLIWGGFF